jgi:hypothetical protein
MGSFPVYQLSCSQFEDLLLKLQTAGLVICNKPGLVEVADPQTSAKLTIEGLKKFPGHFGVFYNTRDKANRSFAARIKPLICDSGGIEI